jgi:hypothetical protein
MCACRPCERKFGIFFGLDALVNKSISLNVEGRFIDEQAITCAVAMRF